MLSSDSAAALVTLSELNLVLENLRFKMAAILAICGSAQPYKQWCKAVTTHPATEAVTLASHDSEARKQEGSRGVESAV